MKDKLEPNMYVRTKDGKIAKFIKYDEEDKEELATDYYEYSTIWIKDVIKASHNIIDLIEEKDFCEIEFYSERYKERVKRIFEVGYVARGKLSHINFENAHCQLDIINGEWSNHGKCLNPNIKSIVTKEMFSSMEYKLEDDK